MIRVKQLQNGRSMPSRGTSFVHSLYRKHVFNGLSDGIILHVSRFINATIAHTYMTSFSSV